MTNKTPKLFSIRRDFNGATLYLVDHSRKSNGWRWTGARKDALRVDLETATTLACDALKSFGALCAVIDAADSVAVAAPRALKFADAVQALIPEHAKGGRVQHKALLAAVDKLVQSEHGRLPTPGEYRTAGRLAAAYENEREANRITHTNSPKRNGKALRGLPGFTIARSK